jgi:hypothetical protein
MPKSFLFIALVAFLVLGVSAIPSYDKYKAGGYKESVRVKEIK